MNHSDEKTPAQRIAELQRTATAFHEAGHAVAAFVLGRQVHKVTIEPGKSAFGTSRLGVCQLGKGRRKASKDLLEEEVIILFAGMVAEARFTGRYCETGASQDLRQIQAILCQRATSEKHHEKLHRRMLDKTEHLIGEQGHVLAIQWLAKELIEKNSLSGRAVKHFVNQAASQSGH